MARIWLTNGTPTIPGILNPLTAACDRGFVPDQAQILSNPGVADSVAVASEMFDTIIDAYSGDADISQYSLEQETDFPDIIDFYRSAIETAKNNGDTIAIDVTPGRKFMSAIAFQAGFQFGADHVYYFHRKAGGYYGQFYAEIPRTATDLIDFKEVL
ncbi:PDDEXK family nuclease [Halorubrum pallidum]|uniref:CRISPR-associated protein n=1 Tax=Halorubrum pallidum TaxID=1526114 RepID=A0ABD5T0L6_9EURY